MKISGISCTGIEDFERILRVRCYKCMLLHKLNRRNGFCQVAEKGADQEEQICRMSSLSLRAFQEVSLQDGSHLIPQSAADAAH